MNPFETWWAAEQEKGEGSLGLRLDDVFDDNALAIIRGVALSAWAEAKKQGVEDGFIPESK